MTNSFEVRFLDLVSPFQKWLPEIISPERKVHKLATSPYLSRN